MEIKIIEPKVFVDEKRGTFTKFEFPFNAAESFYSQNKKNVFRGMHYQHQADKFVYVSKGLVLDVWLNLKTGAWGEVLLKDKGIFIPAGFAHGFYSLTDSNIHYLQSQAYSKEQEGGIAWNSFGFTLKTKPILSRRDKNHPSYEIFRSNTHI